MITHYDLFAGIGGFSLAAEWVWGNEAVEHIFIEWDSFCQQVIKKHWPEAKIHGDIRRFIAEAEATSPQKANGITIVTGGFPCQPFSAAGRRRGTQDDRYLWPEMLRVVQLTKPEWVIAENVRGLASWNNGLVLEQVCTDLEREGYEVQPFIIPAAAVNAPHRRDRVWIIAGRASTNIADTNGGGGAWTTPTSGR